MLHSFLISRLILVLCVARVARLQLTLDTVLSDKDLQSNFLMELKEVVDRYGTEMRQLCQENRFRQDRDHARQQIAVDGQGTLKCRNQNESSGK